MVLLTPKRFEEIKEFVLESQESGRMTPEMIEKYNKLVKSFGKPNINSVSYTEEQSKEIISRLKNIIRLIDNYFKRINKVFK